LRVGCGGIGGLLQLLRERGEAVEADLRRFYGRDLGELFTGEMTFRQLKSYIFGLPLDCALKSHLGWSFRDHRAADLVDLLNAIIWQNGGDKKARKPRPFPRPHHRVAEQVVQANARNFVERQRRRAAANG